MIITRRQSLVNWFHNCFASICFSFISKPQYQVQTHSFIYKVMKNDYNNYKEQRKQYETDLKRECVQVIIY